MKQPGLLIGFGILCFGMIGAAWWLLQALARQDVQQRRIAAVQRGANASPSETLEDKSGLPIRLVAGLGALLSGSGILPASTLAELEQTLVLAGMRQRNGLALFIGGKLLLFLLLPMFVYLALQGSTVSSTMQLMLIGIGAILGLLLPDMIVRSRRTAY